MIHQGGSSHRCCRRHRLVLAYQEGLRSRRHRAQSLELAGRFGRRSLAAGHQQFQRRPQGDKGVQIKLTLVPDDQYNTKILASAATGQAPDFGWGTAGQRAQWAKDGVIVPLDDLAKKVGLELNDFTPFSMQSSRYVKYDNKLFMIPMDLMSLQPEVNLDIVKEAGLDPEKFPTDGDTLIEWAKLSDDEAGRRQGHSLRHHDDRLRRAADGDVGDHRRADGLQAGERRS